MSLCVIVPRLPPSLDGIGDYCRQLWTHIDQLSAQSCWSFLVMDGAEDSRRIWPDATIETLQPDARLLAEQLQALDVSTVLLQYVGYGYAGDGAPQWLPAALSAWKLAAPGRKVIIMFHETFSSGQPWQRVFWQMPAQKRCVAALLSVGDQAVTSMEANAASLRSISKAGEIRIIPIGSSFDLPALPEKNWRQLLVFGKGGSRRTALKRHAGLIKKLADLGLLSQIVCAGQCETEHLSSDSLLLQSLAPQARLATAYNFAADAIPQVVLACGLSLMHTQSTNLLKSTSFQLAAQVGQVPITREERAADAPFRRGHHYLSYSAGADGGIISALKNEASLAAISSNIVSAAGQYLSWRRIAEQWDELLALD